MKVGILTQPLFHNYGGLLQNWALQQVLIGLGHKPVTIRYFGLSKFQQLLGDLRSMSVWLLKTMIRHKSRNVYYLPWMRRSTLKFKKFVTKQIVLTSLINPLREKDIKKNGINVIVVGSDQTWRPMYNGEHLFDMFCNFFSDSCSIPRIAYAASFGVDKWEYSDKETEFAKKGATRFRAISVREKSGVSLCETYLEVAAVCVLDPTLLLDRVDYNRLISIKDLNKIPVGRIGVYILDVTEEKEKIVEMVCHIHNKEAYWFGRKDESGQYHSIEHWLGAFEKCDFIITDSFHGTVFSVNYHRPFITLLNPERGVERFTSLLGLFGLESRMVDSSDMQSVISVIINDINWEAVDVIKNREREKSIQFLIENIVK